jgi:hypothetical protein
MTPSLPTTGQGGTRTEPHSALNSKEILTALSAGGADSSAPTADPLAAFVASLTPDQRSKLAALLAAGPSG